MALPFTAEQFYDVFVRYNDAIWPMQFILYAVAWLTLFLICRGGRANSRVVSFSLAILWIWTAATYHLVFTSISPSGWAFAALSLAGGVWIAWVGGIRNRIAFGIGSNPRTVAGTLLILYALVIYPLVGYAVGHRFPAMPTFGTPCPVTIFTIGALLLTVAPPPRSVFVVPVLWALFAGTTATFQLGVWQDAGLLIAGLIGLIATILRTKPLDIALAR